MAIDHLIATHPCHAATPPGHNRDVRRGALSLGLLAGTAMLVLMPRPAHAEGPSTFKQVSYQSHHRVMEVVDGSFTLHGDILAFPDEVSDIRAMTASRLRKAPVNEPGVGFVRPWKKSRLSYSFKGSVPESVRSLLKEGAEIWMQSTSWEFVETENSRTADFIIRNSKSSCSATVGAPADGNQGSMNLSTDCSLRSMVHELGHIIGMLHEHQRPERRKFLSIRHDTLDFIKAHFGPTDYDAFVHALQPEQYSPGQPYAFDPTSIMMYGSYPQRKKYRDVLMERNLPLYTALDGSLYEASPARLSNKDIATAEYLATLITRANFLLFHD